MSLLKQAQKRRAKKLYGYFIISLGVFCTVLAICIGEFLLTRGVTKFTSPLGTLQKAFLGTSNTSVIVQKISTLCAKYQLSCENINQNADNSVTLAVGDKIVVLSSEKNLEQEIASLQLTIKQLTMEGKEFHRLDFRYDRPVISP